MYLKKYIVITATILFSLTINAQLQIQKLSINTTPKFVFCERLSTPGTYDVFIITTDSNPQDQLFYRHISSVEANLSWVKSTGAALGGSASGFDCNTKNLNTLLADGQASY